MLTAKTTVVQVQPNLWMATAWNGDTAYPSYGRTREEAIIRAESAAAEPIGIEEAPSVT